MTRRITAVALIAVTALAVAACGKANNSSSGGASAKTLVVGVDLPFQGASSDTSNATFNAMLDDLIPWGRALQTLRPQTGEPGTP